MKYSVSINEANRTITVTLSDGTKGMAKCCPTDKFDINTGIELALERAKVAQKSKAGKVIANLGKNYSVETLVKILEAALPAGQMVLVGHGDKMTEAQKDWLRSIVGGCSCDCEEHEKAMEDAYDEGYAQGYEEGLAEGRVAGYDEAINDSADEMDELCEKIDEKNSMIDEILDVLAKHDVI